MDGCIFSSNNICRALTRLSAFSTARWRRYLGVCWSCRVELHEALASPQCPHGTRKTLGSATTQLETLTGRIFGRGGYTMKLERLLYAYLVVNAFTAPHWRCNFTQPMLKRCESKEIAFALILMLKKYKVPTSAATRQVREGDLASLRCYWTTNTRE